jgi:hypothetical protein
MVAVSVTGVSVGRGSRVAVKVGISVEVRVTVAVSGIGVCVSVGRIMAVSNALCVGVGRIIGRIVGTSPMQAARIPPSAPIMAARTSVLVVDESFCVMKSLLEQSTGIIKNCDESR